jgi:hypothetical protein
VLGYGTVRPEELGEAVRTLAAAVNAARGQAPARR